MWAPPPHAKRGIFRCPNTFISNSNITRIIVLIICWGTQGWANPPPRPPPAPSPCPIEQSLCRVRYTIMKALKLNSPACHGGRQVIIGRCVLFSCPSIILVLPKRLSSSSKGTNRASNDSTVNKIYGSSVIFTLLS